jgi:hypothetical protein
MSNGTDIKPGWKTTEFWVSIGGAIAGLGVLTGMFTPEESEQINASMTTIIGGVMTVVSVIGYALTRGKAKQGTLDIQTILKVISTFSSVEETDIEEKK